MLTTYKSILTALTPLLAAPIIISRCISDIHDWFNYNSLKLNSNNTESIFLHLPLCSNTLPNPLLITSGCIDIPYSNNVRSLGVHFISTFSMISHITNMHKSIHYHLHCLRTFCKSVPLEISIIIASSYILPNFDYCNNLLFNLPIYKINKL